ncbi:hypothetical protein VOLCADRAFT_91202 [Volvox carteri f. nagariensis]|uniref:Uncharacterized protein n=1 Tax=Volvox carteri f. nagariensis TaxID=3068 RepID=D8TWG1_VOLCA|nr:uncharacterized protein VOLCADRAFT_91202 [Volvox carteri f. nagariensis]XP_002959596.1 uncharacterized protein VOLCADRAFT_101097 [Volvox carteri f. nagariensis]EFJ39337.1 hypothetical protein VOLCADRAFT_101097 [Volvox carteri f. nagariensis]EFJ48041.1 hypothetical protein VOLCADRAFT_91202 [Volvox carteri f. nagariensis]|eukprot:XP_002950726.1 hypothetical protein VOLCADRAFT_91202 [Volvox carteri f. nagariensis]
MADQADKPDTKQPDHQPDNIEVCKYGDKNLDAPAYANVLKEAKAKQRASWWVRFNVLLTTGAVWLQCVRCNKILSAKNPSQVCSQHVRACYKKLMEAAAGGSRMPPSPSPQPGPSTTPSAAPPAAPSNDPSAGLSAGPSAPPGPFAGPAADPSTATPSTPLDASVKKRPRTDGSDVRSFYPSSVAIARFLWNLALFSFKCNIALS